MPVEMQDEIHQEMQQVHGYSGSVVRARSLHAAIIRSSEDCPAANSKEPCALLLQRTQTMGQGAPGQARLALCLLFPFLQALFVLGLGGFLLGLFLSIHTLAHAQLLWLFDKGAIYYIAPTLRWYSVDSL
jgi:hypothetical protein